MSRPVLTVLDPAHPPLGFASRTLLERIAGNVRHLLDHLAGEERKYRMCPICRCEYALEPHDEDCAYEDAVFALSLLDTAVGHIDERPAGA